MSEFNIRNFKATDVFVVARIINKVGLSNFSNLLSVDNLRALVAAGTEDGEADVSKVGLGVILEAVDIALARIDAIEDDLLNWLGSMSGIEDVGEMPADEFLELIEAVVESEGFRSFFTAAAKLAKKKASQDS